MALREYKCPHGHSVDLIFADAYPEKIVCEECGALAKIQMSNFAYAVTFRYGWDAGAGKGFDSKRQRDNHLAANNLEPVPDGAYEAAYKG